MTNAFLTMTLQSELADELASPSAFPSSDRRTHQTNPMLSRNDILELLEERPGPCVSIYLPTHRAIPEIEQDPIRFKNLLRAVESDLCQKMRGPEVTELLRDAVALRKEPLFWKLQGDGLACFIAPDFFQFKRAPLSFQESYRIGDRFHVTPLLPLLTGNGRFLILALSQESARLFEATPHSMREIPLEDIPEGVASLVPERRVDSSLQYHAVSGGGRQRAPAVFHGHNVASEKEKADILRFLRKIDRGLHEILNGQDAPMILACVGFLASLYESINTYPNLVPAKVPGNPDSWTRKELHARAYQMARPYLLGRRDHDRRKCQELLATPWASDDVHEIVPAAEDGRVDSLFFDRTAHCPGSFNSEQRIVTLDDQNGDLVELAAEKTLLGGGSVYAVDRREMPGETALAAIFRYVANSNATIKA